MARQPIPVIDLFAGPGGLAEGFSAATNADNRRAFRIALSIEKDAVAHQTLQLRSFVRSFAGQIPDCYYDCIRGKISKEELFKTPGFRENVRNAQREAWHLTLGPETHSAVSRRVGEELKGHDTWVLIGGPPCQAYSLMGRSRMRSQDVEAFEKDERHFLYREYLRIIAEHAPAVFIMENVKGLLSSTIAEKLIFSQILEDLQRPNGGSLRYSVVPLSSTANLFNTDPRDFILRSELLGIPQARHRVILCGVRQDLIGSPRPLSEQPAISVRDAIADLPSLRGGLSKTEDSPEQWMLALLQGAQLAEREADSELADVVSEMFVAARNSRQHTSRGGHFVATRKANGGRREVSKRFFEWIHDPKLDGVTGHEARRHMRSDLYRYLFASSYAMVNGVSPKLDDFPSPLLPKHKSARPKKGRYAFADRFRVQLWGETATTVTSHISKDGHYFIHPDPSQGRSLTVREAARLQTFPDNYHFEGNRTQQFHQVGNAVPPLLARQIAMSVAQFLSAATGSASKNGNRAA